MRLIKTAATGLIALSSIALVTSQNAASSSTHTATSASVYDTGKLRAVVIGDALPMVEKNGDGYDGLSFVVLDAIRDQINVSPLRKDKDVSIEPVAVNSPTEGLDKIRSGDADIACGVDFSWQRQRTLTYTLPFAMGGVRVLAPAGNDGTPESLNGETVGVVKDTLASSVLASSVDNATLKFFDSPGDALSAMKDGSIEFLGGNTLWLRANQAATAPDAALVPTLPYARSSIACVVADTTPKLLNISNLAIGRLLSSYINDNTEVRSAINQWIGKGSSVGLSDDQIGSFFSIVLSTSAEFSKQS
ncbi:extracellular substrate binding-like orphan protein GrrP [Synechococcus sp. A15-60]|uniref:extracellular substrate binding-like orphan protein GrrP n=1 Tax=Synechococcus sp. A15-60 TaxID=1050655 RepID=UPI00164775AA|nr:extracellular substrate binding-like orphan protein GrrP [Synechococcus sp. A15-60]QNI47410.1 extracellular substrate-binding orphan/ GRRM family protein [Synechococcus sp. A15-60]